MEDVVTIEEQMTPEQRLKNLETAMHQMSDHYWRFQGRINALELIATLATLDFAKTQPNPFQFIQDYIAAMRVTSSKLTPDVDDPTKGDRLRFETKDSIDHFLAELLQHAGQLKGAPGNQ
jgi:hypothetical protein